MGNYTVVPSVESAFNTRKSVARLIFRLKIRSYFFGHTVLNLEADLQITTT